MEKSRSMGDLHHLRLMTLLQELVRDKGGSRERRGCWAWITARVNADQYLTHQRRFSFDPPPGPWLGFLGRKAS